MNAVDLVVIGTGGAAMAAGIEARSRGKSAVLIEHGPLGGTCLNIGCVPSENLLAAGRRHRAQVDPFPAVPTGAGDVDMAALIEQKQELVDRLRQVKYADVDEAHGFPVRYGHAQSSTSRPSRSTGSQWWRLRTWWPPARPRTSKTCLAWPASTT